MILYRFKKLCRIFNAVFYSCSLVIFLFIASVPILRLVENYGVFNTKVTTLITCVSPAEANGRSTFHGKREYVRPAIAELLKMKETCESEEEKRTKDWTFFDHFDNFGFYPDCSVIGTEHKRLFFSSFAEVCVNEKMGSNKSKEDIQQSDNFDYDGEELLFYLIFNFLFLVFTYSTGYVFFGVSSISPLALFKKNDDSQRRLK